MKKILLLLITLFPVVLFAEPYLAIREGLKCSACHVNRTGGGKRTQMGTGFGAQALPWQKIDLNEKKIPHYWSVLNDLLSVGGDFRFLNQTTFIEDNTANTFQTDKGNIYLLVKALPDILSLYVDERVAPGGVQSREIFGMLEAMPAHGWIKAGRFILPYGIRLEDDRSFIREVTGFTFDNPDAGVEVGFEPGRFSIVTSATNGTAGANDNNASKQFVGSFSYVHDSFRVGISGNYNPSDAGDRTSGGLWGGFRFHSAVLLGEVDLVKDQIPGANDREQFVAHAEIDYLITEGWNVKAAYEFYDPNRDIDENERDRVVIGVEPFIVPFLQLGVYYKFNQSIPQNIPQNADELTFRIHVYF
jgi:hypothetical protein